MTIISVHSTIPLPTTHALFEGKKSIIIYGAREDAEYVRAKTLYMKELKGTE